MRDRKRPRRTVAEHGPHPTDVYVGGRVRMRRMLLGMSQTKLGDALGLTFQQIQKNETGINRIGSSRLYQLSHILDVPVAYFFETLEGDLLAESFDNMMSKRETLELVKAYYRIPDPAVRDALRKMAKAMAKGLGSR